jgi:hypothetical protein
MIETLGIQWIELLAQTISFSIVLFVLWKFAYKPIFNHARSAPAENRRRRRQRRQDQGELAKTEADRQKILAEAGDKANKLIERGAQPPPACAKWKRRRPSPPPSKSSSRRAKPPRRITRDARRIETRSRPARGADHRDRHRQNSHAGRPAPAGRGNGETIGRMKIGLTFEISDLKSANE